MSNESAQRWTSLMMKMPDSLFFDLARIYLGEIKTPFTKQEIIGRLYRLFRKPEIQEQILELIGPNEAELLTAIHYMPNATNKNLFQYFSYSKKYLEIHHLIINLEERFLIFTDAKGTLELSPLFKDLLLEKVISLNHLCPGKTVQAEYGPMGSLNDALILGALSIIRGQNPFKKSGELKSREASELCENLNLNQQQVSRLIKTSTALKLIEITEHGVELREEQLEALGLLSPKDRLLLYLTAQHSQKMEKESQSLEMILTLLPSNYALTSEGIQKLMRLCNSRLEAQEFIDTLVSWNVLLVNTDHTFQKNMSFALPQTMEPNDPAVAETNFELRLPPTISFKNHLRVLDLAKLKQIDVMPLYTISKETTLYSLGKGKKASELESILPELAGPHPVAPLIIQSVNDWIRDFHALQIHHGYILKAEPDRIEFLKNIQNVKDNIIDELAPGIFLMKAESHKIWREALATINHQVPPPIQGEPVEEDSKPEIQHFLIESASLHPPKWTSCELQENESIWDDKIESKDFNRDQKEELKNRANKKMILWEGQITEKSLRFEKKEASGLDFNGKVRLINQVIQSKREIIEIVFRATAGDPILFAPAKVVKQNQDHLIQGVILPEEEEREFLISKIAVVRKVPSSLFLY